MGLGLVMKLPELLKAWLTSQDELRKSEKQVIFLTKQVNILEEELKDVRKDNFKLRLKLLCDACKTYLLSKHPGDTVECSPCTHCVGIA